MKSRRTFIGILFIVAIIGGCNKSQPASSPSSTSSSSIPSSLTFSSASSTDDISSKASSSSPIPTAPLRYPIADGGIRITKKPFGIHVTPADSPVQPERFSGYHTGTDFEILPGEETRDVPISAACPGTVLLRQWLSGYGGVLVQSCTVMGEPVTVLYGHLRLSSITRNVGDPLQPGDAIGVLGTAYSTETDGERRHLHFAVHHGTSVVLLGYVQTLAALAPWIDAQTLLP